MLTFNTFCYVSIDELRRAGFHLSMCMEYAINIVGCYVIYFVHLYFIFHFGYIFHI